MSPNRKNRYCRRLGGQKAFRPMGIPKCELDEVIIDLDEFEAIRLCDYEGKSQIEAGDIMGISRGTVQRLLNKGRAKIVHALLTEKILIISDSQKDI